MKFFFITLILPLTLLSPVLSAASSPASPSNKGFYMGVGLGAATLKTGMKVDSLDGVTSDKVKRTLNATAPSFHGFLGYEKTIKDIYVVGVEGHYFYANERTDSTMNLRSAGWGGFETNHRIKASHSYGLNISFGRQFDRITPYLKLGGLCSNFEVSASSPDAGKNIEGSQKIKKFGFASGVGARYAISSRLDFFGETQSIFYPSFKSKNFDGDAGEQHFVTVDPWFFMFLMGLRWKF